MESSSTSKRLTFGDLQSRLLQLLKVKLDNGEFTERGLARMTGISQPQIHNLLKGARRLNTESADILLDAVNLSILDLLTEADISSPELLETQAPHPISSNPILAAVAQQLSLALEPELCTRKNPASALALRLGVTKQAS